MKLLCAAEKTLRGAQIGNEDVDPACAQCGMDGANLAAAAYNAADSLHRYSFNSKDSLHPQRLDAFALLVEEAKANIANRTQAAQLRTLFNRADASFRPSLAAS